MNRFGELMSGIIFVTFCISVSRICTSFFQIHAVRKIVSSNKLNKTSTKEKYHYRKLFSHPISFQNFQHISYLLLQSIMTTIAILLIIFIFCYFGHMVTTECAMVADFVYNASWYRYPIYLQKSTLFIIARSQQPFYFTAYKMYKCTLQSFSSVCILYLLHSIYRFSFFLSC